jgi:hypothetical protein
VLSVNVETAFWRTGGSVGGGGSCCSRHLSERNPNRSFDRYARDRRISRCLCMAWQTKSRPDLSR